MIGYSSTGNITEVSLSADDEPPEIELEVRIISAKGITTYVNLKVSVTYEKQITLVQNKKSLQEKSLSDQGI